MINKQKHALWARKYRRTLKGFIEAKYSAMSKRVRGKDKNCLNTVAGLPIISRKEFYSWTYTQPNIFILFKDYKDSNFQFKLCPTIDRIDPTKGYVISNMRFITQSENAKGSRWNNKGLTKNKDYRNMKARLNYKNRKG